MNSSKTVDDNEHHDPYYTKDIDYRSIAECLEYPNLPYDKHDKYFKPLTDSKHIKNWNNWLKYTANTIGVTVNDIHAKQFTTLKELLIWCSSGSRYNTASNKYDKQCDKYRYMWAGYIKERYTYECNKFTIDSIAYQMEDWLDTMFRRWFIWGFDTGSIIKATSYDDVAIFDTSPMECFLYEYLINSGLDDEEDDEDEEEEEEEEEDDDEGDEEKDSKDTKDNKQVSEE